MDKLPELPKLKKKREADITPAVLAWFRLHAPEIGSCLIEIKVSTRSTIPRSAVAPHQLAALRMASGGGICWKIPDVGQMKKPADAFLIVGARGFVVCVFLKHKICRVYSADKWSGARLSDPCVFQFDL